METIKAGGKDRPFRISYKVIKEATRLCEEDKGLDTRNGGLDNAELYFFLGFKYGALKEGKEVDFSQSDIVDWMDDDLSLLGKLTGLLDKALPQQEGKKKGG